MLIRKRKLSSSLSRSQIKTTTIDSLQESNKLEKKLSLERSRMVPVSVNLAGQKQEIDQFSMVELESNWFSKAESIRHRQLIISEKCCKRSKRRIDDKFRERKSTSEQSRCVRRLNNLLSSNRKEHGSVERFMLVTTILLVSIIASVSHAGLLSNKLPDLTSGTNDEPIVASAGADAYISCVANNLQNYTIIWRFSNDAHAPSLADGISDTSPNDKLEDADATATILTAGRQRVTSDERFTVIRSHNTWLLKISNVRLSDTGTYICQTNSDPRVRALRILSVLKKSKNEQSPSVSSFNLDDDGSLLRGQNLQMDYNFTECCKQEYVYPRCQKLCSIQQLASKYHTLNIVHECYNALPSISRCMVAGRNVVSCCERQHVPARCHSMCGKSADAAMSVSIQDQSYCKDYSASIMSCKYSVNICQKLPWSDN